jgi:hypothetical protein
VVAAALSVCVLAGPVAGQAPSPWDARTAWGDPDLQGLWTIGHMTGVPLERPARFGERGELTDAEFAQRAAQLEAAAGRYERERRANRMGIGHWAEVGQPQRQASLIVDPPDGRLPALTRQGRRRAAGLRSSWQNIPFDGVEDFDTWDRCITRGLPASMLPMQYNNGIEIVQAPGYVVLRLEMIHEARIVPVDGRPALDPAIRQWMGEPRGRWEGSTLVVETTNFNGIPAATNVGTSGSPRQNDVPTSPAMRMTERFTRVDAETIEVRMTVEDPDVFTRPWTVALTMRAAPDYRMFEYACHEGNATIRDYITASRAERASRP